MSSHRRRGSAVEAKRRVEFTNRLMFNRVVCNEDVCRDLIRALLGIEAGAITYLNAEQVYEPGFESRGVRMDVVAKEGSRIYDIEMQMGPEADIGRRMRYYQAAMDVGELGSGGEWRELPESHIVFVCHDDLLGRGLPVYSIDRFCREVPDLDVGDASHWHVLNAAAWEEVPDAGVRSVLEYVRTGRATDELSRKIDGLVARYNEDRKWVSRAMYWETEKRSLAKWERKMGREEGLAQGLEQGLEQGQERFAALAIRLVELGRTDDITRAAENRTYRDELYEEFAL